MIVDKIWEESERNGTCIFLLILELITEDYLYFFIHLDIPKTKLIN